MTLTLYHLTPGFGLPAVSPFALKLATWLRMVDVPFEMVALKGPPKSKNGKVPYVRTEDGRQLEDSQHIIEVLAAERGLALTPALSEKSLAHGHMVRRLAEQSLYFALVWERWLDAGYPSVREAYFDNIPGLLRPLVAGMVRQQMVKMCHAQGVSRQPREALLAQADADLSALAAALGQRDFFLGEPSVVDAAVYGQLAQLWANPYESPIKERLARHEALVAFVGRVGERWWGAPQVPGAQEKPGAP